MVRDKVVPAPPPAALAAGQPQDIVIVGGSTAGVAGAEMLRQRGYQGRLTMLSQDADAPCDRPNLSKDDLAGAALEGWIPLTAAETEAAIEMALTRFREIDATVTIKNAGYGVVGALFPDAARWA